jgi:hypothetical protein
LDAHQAEVDELRRQLRLKDEALALNAADTSSSGSGTDGRKGGGSGNKGFNNSVLALPSDSVASSFRELEELRHSLALAERQSRHHKEKAEKLEEELFDSRRNPAKYGQDGGRQQQQQQQGSPRQQRPPLQEEEDLSRNRHYHQQQRPSASSPRAGAGGQGRFGFGGGGGYGDGGEVLSPSSSTGSGSPRNRNRFMDTLEKSNWSPNEQAGNSNSYSNNGGGNNGSSSHWRHEQQQQQNRSSHFNNDRGARSRSLSPRSSRSLSPRMTRPVPFHQQQQQQQQTGSRLGGSGEDGGDDDVDYVMAKGPRLTRSAVKSTMKYSDVLEIADQVQARDSSTSSSKHHPSRKQKQHQHQHQLSWDDGDMNNNHHEDYEEEERSVDGGPMDQDKFDSSGMDGNGNSNQYRDYLQFHHRRFASDKDREGGGSGSGGGQRFSQSADRMGGGHHQQQHNPSSSSSSSSALLPLESVERAAFQRQKVQLSEAGEKVKKAEGMLQRAEAEARAEKGRANELADQVTVSGCFVVRSFLMSQWVSHEPLAEWLLFIRFEIRRA